MSFCDTGHGSHHQNFERGSKYSIQVTIMGSHLFWVFRLNFERTGLTLTVHEVYQAGLSFHQGSMYLRSLLVTGRKDETMIPVVEN